MSLSSKHNIFLIGIGGIGMSGLAKYFIEKNKNVFGYDREKSMITIDLTKMGAKIDYNLENITAKYNALSKDDTVVVYTPAIPNNHILLNYFTDNNFDIYKRADILENISRKSKCIAIAGTHGKTTTTSILAHILKCADVSFTAFVGGIMENYNSNFLYNGDEFVLVEADEFDKSFLKLKPDFACITSMDVDHLDIYRNKESLSQAFYDFADNIKFGGLLITHENLEFNSFKYGERNDSDFKVLNINCKSELSIFDFESKKSTIENIKLPLTGHYNVLNATCAIALALELGISENQIISSLISFKGIKRRFSYQIDNENIIYIDDYAHHPEEINKVFDSLKNIYPNDKLTVIFQPHLYSRTRDLAEDFATALSQFDAVILLEIYPAREIPIKGISSEWLLEKIDSNYKTISRKSDISDHIKNIGYRVNITLGAGDIANEVEHIKQELEYAY